MRKIPYDFFSAGEMVTDEDGTFVLTWSAPEEGEFPQYSQIVITANAYEGSSDPGVHLVEGEFGK